MPARTLAPMCQPSRCSPKGIDTRRCTSKDAGYQRGWDLEVVPHRLEEGKSTSEDAGPERGVDCDARKGKPKEDNIC